MKPFAVDSGFYITLIHLVQMMLKILKLVVACVQLGLKYFCMIVHSFGYGCINNIMCKIGIIIVSIASHDISFCACVGNGYCHKQTTLLTLF